jgi:DNA-directed RNA polymerase specialized sigma24 family protein
MGLRTKLEVSKMYELYELYASDENISIADIANMAGISVIYVKKLFNRISKYGNLKTKSVSGIFNVPISDNPQVQKEIKELRDCGFTYQQIANHMDLSRGWVFKLAHQEENVG